VYLKEAGGATQVYWERTACYGCHGYFGGEGDDGRALEVYHCSGEGCWAWTPLLDTHHKPKGHLREIRADMIAPGRTNL